MTPRPRIMYDRKPLGIVLITLLCTFWGVLLVLTGYVTSVAIGVRGAPAYAGVYGFLSVVLGLAMLASAYGLWTLQTWGRACAIGSEIATLVLSTLSLVGLFLGGRVATGTVIASGLGFALMLLALRYLQSDAVRQMYGRGPLIAEAASGKA